MTDQVQTLRLVNPDSGAEEDVALADIGHIRLDRDGAILVFPAQHRFFQGIFKTDGDGVPGLELAGEKRSFKELEAMLGWERFRMDEDEHRPGSVLVNSDNVAYIEGSGLDSDGITYIAFCDSPDLGDDGRGVSVQCVLTTVQKKLGLSDDKVRRDNGAAGSNFEEEEFLYGVSSLQDGPGV